MNDFAKLSLSSPTQRLNSSITVLSANCRDFDHREKFEKLSRKAVHDQEEIGNLCLFFIFNISAK